MPTRSPRSTAIAPRSEGSTRKASAFYQAYSRPNRGLPSPSAAGSWFLETDRRTGLAYPRLVAVANGKSVARANKTLEAIHGRVIQWALEWFREAQWATSGISALLSPSHRHHTTAIAQERKRAASSYGLGSAGVSVSISRSAKHIAR